MGIFKKITNAVKNTAKSVWNEVKDYSSGLLKIVDDTLGTNFEHANDVKEQKNEASTARQFEAEQKNIERDYNTEEADKTRLFNAEQAQLQREWEASQSATAVQRRTEDLKAAGINPILAAGAAADTGTGAMATGSMASTSGTTAPMANLSPSTARKMQALEMLKTKADIEKTKAEELKSLSEAGYTDAQIDYYKKHGVFPGATESDTYSGFGISRTKTRPIGKKGNSAKEEHEKYEKTKADIEKLKFWKK